MKTYPIPMVPGPVSVPREVLAAYREDYGSADLESEFLDLYNRAEANLQQVFRTRNKIAIQSGEGMLALWGALKSCLIPGDRVLAIASGVFGYGIAEMAASLGAVVHTLGLDYDQTIADWDAVTRAMERQRPKMVTAVHCETPSGTLNPLEELGRLKRRYEVPLLYVDAVASLGGAALETDEWSIDLALGATQKCLSAPPGLAFTAVSETAWEVIARVNYQGYDALLPFRTAQADFYFPYTHTWHGLAGLDAALELILAEGLEACLARHERVAARGRERLVELGLALFPAAGAVPSPTVTAVRVPEGLAWAELDDRLRGEGLAVGGSYGPLAGKVFRLGHMGSQADEALLERALSALERSLRSG
jgi:aspartate aminotransferase-like enzyme